MKLSVAEMVGSNLAAMRNELITFKEQRRNMCKTNSKIHIR